MLEDQSSQKSKDVALFKKKRKKRKEIYFLGIPPKMWLLQLFIMLLAVMPVGRRCLRHQPSYLFTVSSWSTTTAPCLHTGFWLWRTFGRDQLHLLASSHQAGGVHLRAVSLSNIPIFIGLFWHTKVKWFLPFFQFAITTLLSQLLLSW